MSSSKVDRSIPSPILSQFRLPTYKDTIDEQTKRKRKNVRIKPRHVVNHAATVAMLDWSHDSKYILTVDERCQVTVLDVVAGKPVYATTSRYFDYHPR